MDDKKAIKLVYILVATTVLIIAVTVGLPLIKAIQADNARKEQHALYLSETEYNPLLKYDAPTTTFLETFSKMSGRDLCKTRVKKHSDETWLLQFPSGHQVNMATVPGWINIYLSLNAHWNDGTYKYRFNVAPDGSTTIWSIVGVDCPSKLANAGISNKLSS